MSDKQTGRPVPEHVLHGPPPDPLVFWKKHLAALMRNVTRHPGALSGGCVKRAPGNCAVALCAVQEKETINYAEKPPY